MTKNKNLKRAVRARAARTGESYTAALRHVRPEHSSGTGPRPVRLAVAQSVVRGDPGDVAAVRATGEELRRLLREAAGRGARIALFPEGATCFPHKRVMSATGPDEVSAADWSRCDWAALDQEVSSIARLAAELRLWTVLGSVHRSAPPSRPHNSLVVVSDRGVIVRRYDERMLSQTKSSYLYSPGSAPVTFEADGLRFGCALGMETSFPELFGDYEARDVDCVLVATTGGAAGDARAMARQAQGHAAAHGMWIGFAVSAQISPEQPAGVLDPRGEWSVVCPRNGSPAVAVADLRLEDEEVAQTVRLGRAWRRRVRAAP